MYDILNYVGMPYIFVLSFESDCDRSLTLEYYSNVIPTQFIHDPTAVTELPSSTIKLCAARNRV